MRGSIVARVVDVHKGAVYDGHRLEEVRQDLAQVVGVLERRNSR